MRGSTDAVVTDEELLFCVIWGNQNGSKTAKSHRATVSEVLLEKMATVSMQTQKIASSQLVVGRNSSKSRPDVYTASARSKQVCILGHTFGSFVGSFTPKLPGMTILTVFVVVIQNQRANFGFAVALGFLLLIL